MRNNGRHPGDMLANNDQNIISENDNVTTILVPSNGYTFPRTDDAVSVLSQS